MKKALGYLLALVLIYPVSSGASQDTIPPETDRVAISPETGSNSQPNGDPFTPECYEIGDETFPIEEEKFAEVENLPESEGNIVGVLFAFYLLSFVISLALMVKKMFRTLSGKDPPRTRGEIFVEVGIIPLIPVLNTYAILEIAEESALGMHVADWIDQFMKTEVPTKR